MGIPPPSPSPCPRMGGGEWRWRNRQAATQYTDRTVTLVERLDQEEIRANEKEVRPDPFCRGSKGNTLSREKKEKVKYKRESV